uniref:ATP synthase F0 subunit 8 n=1 Tax=Curculionoidea sp. 10 KM-2017 TaxID=2219393 RepID=A0A346RI96_9CUCU|nr:ATP synthase F0 subunit 8 [Curculionoidea sp. 10 KM-2017]
MPQMAPLNWTLLFIYFILILMISNSTIYFLTNYKIKNFMFKKKITLNNWKW